MTIDAPVKRKPGRPKKITAKLLQELEKEEEVMQESDHPKALEMPELKIKHIVRGIARGAGGIEGEVPVYEIESYVSSYVAQGWKLFATHYLGEDPNAYMMMYVLIRE